MSLLCNKSASELDRTGTQIYLQQSGREARGHRRRVRDGLDWQLLEDPLAHPALDVRCQDLDVPTASYYCLAHWGGRLVDVVPI